jgi:hypothetical protein
MLGCDDRVLGHGCGQLKSGYLTTYLSKVVARHVVNINRLLKNTILNYYTVILTHPYDVIPHYSKLNIII